MLTSVSQGGIFVSGDHGSAGKTTVTLGLITALREYASAGHPLPEGGRIIQPFKKGPDFIDPIWHTYAAGLPCRNLDFFISPDSIVADYTLYSSRAHLSVTEGNKGLFDGVDTFGSDSGSALARLLGLPVILVVDASRSTRGVAALIQGYLNFEKNLTIAGVIVNRISGSRHESKVRSAIEYYTPVRYLGAIPRDPGLSIDERHLGLMPAQEHSSAAEKLAYIKESVLKNVDLDGILDIANTALPLQHLIRQETEEAAGDPEIKKNILLKNIIIPGKEKNGAFADNMPDFGISIAVAKDAAFIFYYPENLEALEKRGARLVFFSPLKDTSVPDEADALYFGGGFPEMFRKELEANESMRRSLRKALLIDEIPAYAECGGLMYLTKSITDENGESAMVGALPFRTIMSRKPQGRGYMSFVIEENAANQAGQESDWVLVPGEYRCHEFHYSRIEPDADCTDSVRYLYNVTRGSGIDGEKDGIVYKNILASYAHLSVRNVHFWADSFINAAKKAFQRRFDAQWERSGSFSCGCEL